MPDSSPMLERARAIRDEVVDTRRRIHSWPELGYQEERTAALVADRLRQLGIPHRTGVARTGVVGELTRGDGPTVVVRADMDALPIHEETGLDFASERDGCMHACGHDCHTAMALGAARLLADPDTNFAGTVRFVFQPAEEGAYDDPERYSGGRRMVLEGALDGVSAAVGLHQIPWFPVGLLEIHDGPVLAAADFFRIHVRGKAAHAGVAPQTGIDAVMVAAQVVNALQAVVARNVGPREAAVVSVTAIHGGEASNIICDHVEMIGTIRALDDAVHKHVRQRCHDICRSIGDAHGATVEFLVDYELPVTANDAGIAALARTSAGLIADHVRVGEPMLGAEDFSWIAREVPACFALLGSRVEPAMPGDEVFGLHHPRMLVNEDALPIGTAFLAQTALDLLAHFTNEAGGAQGASA